MCMCVSCRVLCVCVEMVVRGVCAESACRMCVLCFGVVVYFCVCGVCVGLCVGLCLWCVVCGV